MVWSLLIYLLPCAPSHLARVGSSSRSNSLYEAADFPCSASSGSLRFPSLTLLHDHPRTTICHEADSPFSSGANRTQIPSRFALRIPGKFALCSDRLGVLIYTSATPKGANGTNVRKHQGTGLVGPGLAVCSLPRHPRGGNSSLPGASPCSRADSQ